VTTEISVSIEDGLTIIGASNNEAEYCLWQIEKGDENNIYFEFDDQVNGGYNPIKECTIMRDGMHFVLSTDKLHHFYFNSLPLDKYRELVSALESNYTNTILQVIDR